MLFCETFRIDFISIDVGAAQMDGLHGIDLGSIGLVCSFLRAIIRPRLSDCGVTFGPSPITSTELFFCDPSFGHSQTARSD
jgi:hypothetical protein